MKTKLLLKNIFCDILLLNIMKNLYNFFIFRLMHILHDLKPSIFQNCWTNIVFVKMFMLVVSGYLWKENYAINNNTYLNNPAKTNEVVNTLLTAKNFTTLTVDGLVHT